MPSSATPSATAYRPASTPRLPRPPARPSPTPPSKAPLDGFAATVDAFRAAGGAGLTSRCRSKSKPAPTPTTSASVPASPARPTPWLSTAPAAGPRISTASAWCVHHGQPGPAHRRPARAGAGGRGAARGALQPLLAAGPERLFVANRSADKAHELVQSFHALGLGRGVLAAGGWADLPATGAFDIVINATSASLDGRCAAPARGGVCARWLGLRHGVRQGAHTLSASGARGRRRPPGRWRRHAGRASRGGLCLVARRALRTPGP